MESTHSLGISPLTVSRLAYGCWRIAEADDAAVDFQTATAAIDAAVGAGYTLFDLADIYCRGRSEATFGRVLRERPGLRDKIVIATKCGIRFAGEPTASAPYRYDSSAEHIVRSCEDSLRRIGVETIDLYQLHRPDYLMHPEEVADAFSRLRHAGKVREFAVSNFRPSQVALLQKSCGAPLVANQIEISLLQQGALEDGALDQCLAERMTPLAWSPLAGGLLGGGATNILPAQTAYKPEAALAELDRLVDEHGGSRMQIALAWLLQHPACILPIIGSTQPRRIYEAAAALSLKLSREEWYRLLVAGRGTPLP
jgi:predicted oxidoreductase